MAPKKRGRPPKLVSVTIVRELTAEDIEQLEATRDRGGRPANRVLNNALLQGWAMAKRRGESKRGFIREFFLRGGTALTPIEECRYERQLNRLCQSRPRGI